MTVVPITEKTEYDSAAEFLNRRVPSLEKLQKSFPKFKDTNDKSKIQRTLMIEYVDETIITGLLDTDDKKYMMEWSEQDQTFKVYTLDGRSI